MKLKKIDLTEDGAKYADEEGHIWVVDFYELVPLKPLSIEHVLRGEVTVNYITDFYNLHGLLEINFRRIKE